MEAEEAVRPASRDAAEAKEERRQQLKVAMVARDREDIEPLRVALEAAREVGLGEEDVEPAEELLRKLEADAAPLTFVDVPQEDMERLQAAETREQAVAILMQCFGLSVDEGFQAQILAEFHYHNFAFCRQRGFCGEKTSTFLSIMERVHTKSILDERLPIEKAQEMFERLLQLHSQQLPPYRVGAFTKQEADLLRDHAARSFFRLYALHLFASQHCEDLAVDLRELRLVPQVPDLAPLHVSFQVDPLEAMQPIPPQAEVAAKAGGGLRPQPSMEAGDLASGSSTNREAPSSDAAQADVHRAVEAALQLRLGALDEKLQQLPSPTPR